MDTLKIYESIIDFPKQIESAWEGIANIAVPEKCPLAKNVVICGMGGSALGGRVVDSLLTEKNRVPVETVTDFELPEYVDKNTLVIISSYSGNTEETLKAYQTAVKKKAMLFCITSSGELKKLIQENRANGYIIDPQYNPSGQPRMGLGYSITSILALLTKCGFIETDENISEVTNFLKGLKEEIPKNLAKNLKGKIPVLIGARHTIGALHAFKNCLNENAKTFSCYFDIPELNHHLMEGLKFPKANRKILRFVFFDSDLYPEEIRKRFSLTKDVVGKNRIKMYSVKLQGTSMLQQVYELVLLGLFTSFYLSQEYKIDPGPIPWVDYFKEKISLI